ncbi:synaptic plasticity regulator PANTS isoform X4 [Bubalus kerabau]|uniref:UPF0545 protein C22orf39 homolog isoform X1 n=1 Tax=Bubalus bubalis TaxID=89462 RepID=UPI000DBC5808|nr:UPF0545 protein C22orf39 homolog isoform X1 [Bubalus bubalis]XP_055405850.1 UPF0545 protein C22orf39 homolog isoform X4 [Bubalus carabanensis]
MAEGEGWRPPRPCEAYRAEWELCRSAGHFLRHYYVHGERPACGQWRRDLVSCREWEERRSAEAQTLPAWTLLDVQQRLEHNLCPALELMGGRAERSCEGAELAGLRSLCESERARVRAARKHGLVWAPRQSPPEDWHLPLPEDKDG